MIQNIQFLSSDSSNTIKGKIWKTDCSEIRGIIQVVHGMVEHIDRYDRFATEMSKQGYLVVGHDHLGHGYSVRSKDDYGFFGEKGGDEYLIRDIHQLRKKIEKEYPNIPYFLLGFSMGSFLVRRYLIEYPKENLAGAVIMGTGKHCYLESAMGVALTRYLKKIKGHRYISPFVDYLVIGNLQRNIKNRKTESDWLTTKEEEVEKYRQNPMCNFTFTVSAYHDLFETLRILEKPNNLRRMNKDIPIILMSGAEDPVGARGKAVLKLKKQYESLGIKQLECRLYEKARHELFNEYNREQVIEDLVHWIEKNRKNSQI